MEGEVVRASDVIEHKWVTLQELPDYVSKKYFHAVKNFLALDYVKESQKI